ncbi:hypothetical protein HC928_09340 [bacterium]|nr:hypothetical protein [bacterium]
MNEKILRFHYEEIIYALMILATDLRDYSEDDAKSFAEAVHRLDVLAEPSFLKKLIQFKPEIDDEIISNIINLQINISKIYEGLWYKKLRDKSDVLDNCTILSKQLLKRLNEEYVEPIEYSNKNMDVDW